MQKPFRLLIWFFAIYAIICSAAALFLAHTTLQPYRRPLPAGAENEIRQISYGLHSRLDDVQMDAFDLTPLRGWYIRPLHGNGDAVILLHGLGDHRLGTEGYAQILLAHGYSVLMPDARAHGVSGGNYATYGLLERDDIRRWFVWLESKHHPGCIFGFGESMALPSSCSHSTQSQISVLWLRNPPFPASAKSHTIEWDNNSALEHG